MNNDELESFKEIFEVLFPSLITAAIVAIGWYVNSFQNRKQKLREKRGDCYEKAIATIDLCHSIALERILMEDEILHYNNALALPILWASKKTLIKIDAVFELILSFNKEDRSNHEKVSVFNQNYDIEYNNMIKSMRSDLLVRGNFDLKPLE